MTKQARSRKAAEKYLRSEFGLNTKQARAARSLIERKTGRAASRKELIAHPRITASKIAPAKAIVTRAERKRIARPPKVEKPKRVTSLEEWIEEYDAAEEYEAEEYEGGIDTGTRED